MSDTTLVVNESDIKMIPIADMFPSPLNSFDTDDIEDIMTSIEAVGLIEPLTVSGPNAEGKYEILAGERRFKAISKLNIKEPGFMEELPCYVIGDSTMSDILKMLVIEEANLQSRDDFNKDQHRFRVIELYKQLADEGTIRQREIVSRIKEKLKLSKRYSAMYMTVFREGIPELRESVQSENKKPDKDGNAVHIPVSVASRIAKLPEEDQREIVERVNKGEPAIAALGEVKGQGKKESIPKESDFKATHPESQVSNTPSMSLAKAEQGLPDELLDEPDFTDDTDPFDETDDFGLIAEDIRRAGTSADDSINIAAFMRGQTKELDVTCDTSGKVRQLKNDSSTSHLLTEERKSVAGWIRHIRKKIEKKETLEDEDITLIDQMSDLLEDYNRL